MCDQLMESFHFKLMMCHLKVSPNIFKNGKCMSTEVLSNPRRLISSFDVRFVLLAGSSMPFFVEGVVLQIADG